MMSGKNYETGLFCNKTSPLYNLNQQGYANIQHNQRLKVKLLHLVFLEEEWIKQMCQILTTFSLHPLLQLISEKTSLDKILVKSLKRSLFKKVSLL